MANYRTPGHLGFSITSPTCVLFAAARSANFIAPPTVDRADHAPALPVTRHVHDPEPGLHLSSHAGNTSPAPEYHLQSIYLPAPFSGHRSTQFALRFAHGVQLGLTYRSTRTLPL